MPLPGGPSGGPCRHFAGRQHAANNRRIELVFALADVARVVFHAQDEHRQHAFLVELLLRECDRQNAVQSMFAVGGLVTVLADIPGKNPDLIVVVRQAIVRLCQQA